MRNNMMDTIRKTARVALAVSIGSAIAATLVAFTPIAIRADEYDDYDDYGYDPGDYYWSCETAEISSGGIGSDQITVGASTCASVTIREYDVDPSQIDVVWSSSDPSVARVEGSGCVVNVVGVSEGYAGLTATLTYFGEMQDQFYTGVTVNAAPTPSYIAVQAIRLDRTSVSFAHEGDTTTIGATVLPENATNKGLSWSSNNEDVAIVDNGYIRARGSGTAVITVKSNDNGIPAYVNVTVGPSGSGTAAKAVSLQLATMNIGVGQFMMLIPTVYPDSAANKLVTWASTDPSIATVTDTGLVMGVNQGKAIIVCSTVDGGKSTSCVVNVGPAQANLSTGLVVTGNVMDPNLNYSVVKKIQAAKKNGTVTVTETMPKSFDKTVAAFLATRPDVKIVCKFPFNGHNFSMTIPKGFNLTAVLNKAGYVEWLDLCKLDPKFGIQVKMLN